MSDETKSSIAEFVRTWAPLMVALAGWIWTGAQLYADNERHSVTLVEHQAIIDSQREAIHSLDRMVERHNTMIAQMDREIERLRSEKP